MDNSLTNGYYLEHYFNLENAGRFLLVVFLALAAVIAVLLLASRVEISRDRKHQETDRYSRRSDREKHYRAHRFNLIERFYEMCFSSTSVLFFLSLYNIIDWHIPAASQIWQTYQNVILLLFIILSVFLTGLFDVVVKLPHMSVEEKADVRLTSSFYIVFILLYIRFIYQDTNYDQMILYFLTLAIGRFFYFDFTWKDFRRLLAGVGRNAPIMLLLILYSAIVCWYGFYSGFLLTSNGVIISVFIAHLFMDPAIVIIDKTKIVRLLLKKTDTPQ